MFLFQLSKFKFLYSPDDSGGSNVSEAGPASDDKQDIINFLGDEDPSDEPIDLTPKKKETKSKETVDVPDDEESDVTDNDESEDKEDDELEALIDETEEPTDEQLELMTPVRRREILKKYPALFKDFPYLEKAYYREQQFTEIFPTIPEARQAVEKSHKLDRFEKDLMGGNVETILNAVKSENQNSFNKIVDDILPTIAKIDQNAYHHILGNIFKTAITQMVQESRKSNSEPLGDAAKILHQFVFGTSEWKPPSKLSKDEQVEKKPDELSQREQEFNKRQFETTRNELDTRVNNALKATIEANIDPKNSMTDYVKRNASREVSEKLESLIKQDKRFGLIVDRLWEDAFKKGFNKESVDRIRSAYLSKSKTLLPAVIKQARIEALRGMGKRVSEDKDDRTEQPDKTRPRERSVKSESKNGIPRGMKTLDFLNSD